MRMTALLTAVVVAISVSSAGASDFEDCSLKYLLALKDRRETVKSESRQFIQAYNYCRAESEMTSEQAASSRGIDVEDLYGFAGIKLTDSDRFSKLRSYMLRTCTNYRSDEATRTATTTLEEVFNVPAMQVAAEAYNSLCGRGLSCSMTATADGQLAVAIRWADDAANFVKSACVTNAVPVGTVPGGARSLTRDGEYCSVFPANAPIPHAGLYGVTLRQVDPDKSVVLVVNGRYGSCRKTLPPRPRVSVSIRLGGTVARLTKATADFTDATTFDKCNEVTRGVGPYEHCVGSDSAGIETVDFVDRIANPAAPAGYSECWRAQSLQTTLRDARCFATSVVIHECVGPADGLFMACRQAISHGIRWTIRATYNVLGQFPLKDYTKDWTNVVSGLFSAQYPEDQVPADAKSVNVLFDATVVSLRTGLTTHLTNEFPERDGLKAIPSENGRGVSVYVPAQF